MRTPIVGIVSLLVAGFGLAVMGVHWSRAIVMALVFACGCDFVIRGWRAFMQGLPALQEDWQRLLATWRGIVEEGPMIRALYMTGFAAAFLWCTVAIAADRFDDNMVVWASFVLLGAGGGASVVIRISRLLRLVWSAALGKVLSVTTGVALIAISLALAKRITHDLAQVNPAHFVEFTSVLAACILPYLWIALALWLLVLYAVGQFVAFAVYCLCTSASERLRDFVTIFRVVDGGAHDERARRLERTTIIGEWMARIAGTMLLACGLAAGLDMLGEMPRQLKPYLKEVLVFMEYRPGSACTGLGTLPVAYLDNEMVSVATKVDGEYQFEETKCHLGPE